jgi:hypothetical protein
MSPLSAFLKYPDHWASRIKSNIAASKDAIFIQLLLFSMPHFLHHRLKLSGPSNFLP